MGHKSSFVFVSPSTAFTAEVSSFGEDESTLAVSYIKNIRYQIKYMSKKLINSEYNMHKASAYINLVMWTLNETAISKAEKLVIR